jgi:ubiquitin conjugation factor E4 B
MKWNALPEYFVEDIAEIVLFYLQYVFDSYLNKKKCILIFTYIRFWPIGLKDISIEQINIFILVLLSNTSSLIKNPYLIAKLVEILFTSCPMIQPQANYFHDNLINFPFAENTIVSSLMKFYSGIYLI